MIELAGYRYAVGTRTACLTTALVWSSGVAYVLYAAYWGLLWTRGFGSDGLRALLVRSCVVALIAVGFFAVWNYVVFLSADKQPVVAPAAPDVSSSRTTSWWHYLWDPEGEFESRATSPLAAPVVIVFAGALLSLELPRWGAPTVLCGLAAAAEIVAMASHWVRLRLVRNRMRDEAPVTVDGRVDLYRGFDWDRFDISDEVLFRRRFIDARWKPPTAIMRRAEAAAYAGKARTKQQIYWLGAAVITLVVVTVALVPAQAILRQALEFGAESPPAPGVGGELTQAAIWAVCIVALVLPSHLQHRSREMGDLANIYDDRCRFLRDEGNPAEPDLQSEATPALRGTVIGIGRYKVRLQRLDVDCGAAHRRPKRLS